MTNTMRLGLLRIVVLIAVVFRTTSGEAVGLGPLRLQSALGQQLRASVQLLGDDNRGLAESCILSRLTSPDGSEILRPEIELRRQKDGVTEIFLSSRKVVEEPAATLLVEVVCSPTLHRKYQLLLDMRDGLPHALASDDDNTSKSLPRPVAARADKVAGKSASAGSGKRKSRAVPAAGSGFTGTDLAMMPADGAGPVRSRSRGLPGARNVLKLSQDDINFRIKPGSGGLKLSDTLSIADTRAATVNSDDIIAAKARFVAMLKNEDPVMQAQKQVSTLQGQLNQLNQLNQTVAPPLPASPAAKTASASDGLAIKNTVQAAPDFNKWLVLLAALLLGVVGIAAFILRSAKRPSQKRATPWWQASSDTDSREAALLDSVRSSLAGNKGVRPKAGRELEDAGVQEDDALHQYVARYVEEQESDPAAGKADKVQSSAPVVPDSATAAGNVSTDGSAHYDIHGDMHGPSHAGSRNLSTFEPVSDVMQEAEFWKMLNETSRAIDILENYCNDEDSASPVPWLYLADLYSANGETERHAQLRDRFHQRFNARISESEVPGEGSRYSLEEYPYLMQQISDLWQGNDVLPFLQGLLINNRDDPREGFDLLVYREILLLIDLVRERDRVEA